MSGAGESASLRLRAAAVCVDTVPLAIAGLVLVVRSRKRPPPTGSAFVSLLSAIVRSAASSVPLTLWGATPGQKLMGLRVVDATTGRNLSFRRAVTRYAAVEGVGLLHGLVRLRWPDAGPNRFERASEPIKALEPRIAELRTQYGDDNRGFYEAVGALYREHNVGISFRACLDPWIVGSILHSVALYVPAFRSARRQGLHDRLAHAVVIRTR